MLFSLALTAWAGNTKTTVTQVTSAVNITNDVDYVITGETPFATSGSVNIQNVEHGVVIIQKAKPSVVLKNWIQFIYINGEPAVDGENCQVKMFNRGAIIFPYGKTFKPLTCYTEADFAGESCNNYSEGSNGGFMKSLSTATLNNNIKSFKLKRGYMVTFALGTAGWGYSRCFIADMEDLEINLPANMSGRVSSYRLFKWWNASKAGIHDTSASTNNALNTTSCFDWAQGNASLLPDVEWVPNHIYEDWPSAATCGSVTGSCHMKTNNEPGNSADDHPQDVETVLNNWQNLMRTGMRLCSESSHDGSMNHLKTFIEEIDKRGWRCDILDLHCYWPQGTFNNLTWYSDNYGNGRPIWISEWVWGASWNNNGIFAVSNRGDYQGNWNTNYNGTKPILDILNSNDRVERYYYWNSEADCSKIIKDGWVSKLGEYYATMETGLAYNSKNEYIPKVVYNSPTDLKGDYSKAKGTYTLTWNDSNGDMLDSLVVECKRPGTSKYTWVGNVALKDMNAKNGATYTYIDEPEAGANYYRIAAYPIGSKTAKYSGEVSVTVSSSKGTDSFQYGNISVTNTTAITTDFSEQFAEIPAIFMGIISNKNTKLYPGNMVTKNLKYALTKSFDYKVIPWSKQTDGATSITSAEEIPFMAIAPGNGKFGELPYEVNVASITTSADIEVTFKEPFEEGVTPVVITELRNPTIKTYPYCVRVWDVTNKGFKAAVKYEESTGSASKLAMDMCYLAIAQGKGTIVSSVNTSELVKSDTIKTEEVAYELEEGSDEITYKTIYTMNNTYKNTIGNVNVYAAVSPSTLYGATMQSVMFKIGDEQLSFKNPLIYGGLQSYNYHNAVILRRIQNVKTDGNVTGMYVKRNIDGTSTTTDKNTKDFADTFGWIVLNNDNTYEEVTKEEQDYVIRTERIDPTGIKVVKGDKKDSSQSKLNVRVSGRVITVETDQNYTVHNAAGLRINEKARALEPGVYVVTIPGKSVKILVK